MGTLVRDDRGLSVIETALILPLLLLIVVAGFQIWRLSMLERALYIGTYQAARYLANDQDVFTRGGNNSDFVRRRATLFVMEELKATGFYDPDTMGSPVVEYRYASTECQTRWGGREVFVQAALLLDAPTRWLERLYPWPMVLSGSCDHNPCNE